MFCENPHINSPFGYSPEPKAQKQFLVQMAIPASKVLFLFFLSIVLVPSSEAHLFKDVEEQQIFYYEAIQHDVVFPSTPVTVTVPPDNSAPAIITIPSTNTVPVPNTNPVNPPAPVTTPSTKPGGQPASNPVTTYPSPTGVGVPVTNPVTPPAATNAPATTRKGWCVAKTGVQQSALQAALDYACGIGKADCSAIQQGASCYNPNTLQNHASYAFNNYYQKNPVQTSCDFGGAAAITNVNPSVGSCIFPTSSSSSTPPTTVSPVSSTPPTTASPVSATPPPTTSSPVSGTPTPTTTSPSGTTPSTSTPPSVLNSSSPTLGGFPTSFGDSPPPVFDTSTSASKARSSTSISVLGYSDCSRKFAELAVAVCSCFTPIDTSCTFYYCSSFSVPFYVFSGGGFVGEMFCVHGQELQERGQERLAFWAWNYSAHKKSAHYQAGRSQRHTAALATRHLAYIYTARLFEERSMGEEIAGRLRFEVESKGFTAE
ncbi:unnamed protein product [Fraxinus pennsylvanica]|uniref:X8 domain-containing protein n=1 Tax=Fraxinus pennsylvanica TaxID=56036 RepID=A0AAD2E8X5_9LAMI|nr:unnamed protein product [Fraxinus pennsylvanica]